MNESLIQFKTRLKFLLRFFLNPKGPVYLSGLALEFDESTNTVRLELNRFEEAMLILGNKKMYQVSTNFPLFYELQKIAFKHFGIDQMIEKIGDVKALYLTGYLARGLDSNIEQSNLMTYWDRN